MEFVPDIQLSEFEDDEYTVIPDQSAVDDAVRHPRGAVSADTDRDINFVPPVRSNSRAINGVQKFAKTDDERRDIETVLKHSFLFAHLDPKELSVIVDAVHLIKVSAGTTIMKQGDRGECLYLVQAGELEPNDAGQDLVNVMTAGQVVGELALLYSSPRAATVIAKTDAFLWKLDRQTFTNVVRNLAIQRREQYISFLASVPLLKHLGDYERSQLVDAISSKRFESGETVVNYGDIGDRFYILSSGRAEAVKDGKIMKEYSPGDYFGELALLRDKPRAATVRIKEGPAVCLSLEREAFNRLLGPLEEIMNENAASYDEFCPPK